MPFNDPTITRWPNGFTDVPDTHPANSMRGPFGPNSHTYFNDFDQFVAADWTVTETQAGATQALIAGDGGLLALVNSAAAPDLNSIQKLPAAFTMAAAKKTYVECRLKLDDATLGAAAVGLMVVTATPFTTPTDGLFFTKASAGTSWVATIRQNATTGASNSAAFGTLVNDTFMTMQAYYDGVGTVYYGANGALVGSLVATSGFFPDTILTPTIAVANGSAAARTLTCDYILVQQQR